MRFLALAFLLSLAFSCSSPAPEAPDVRTEFLLANAEIYKTFDAMESGELSEAQGSAKLRELSSKIDQMAREFSGVDTILEKWSGQYLLMEENRYRINAARKNK
ncbi:hypothetical protein [Lewinella sp. W8]|uniref:hypothetical protein n=1 Tax=Lewinella sp. W8 TaxID=2528208 RepID=UPI0010677930|nr:hypothetical protein [Lewinella sp. W8]MTB53019.1 hypothetical protein [Lewinella sp. W8]